MNKDKIDGIYNISDKRYYEPPYKRNKTNNDKSFKEKLEQAMQNPPQSIDDITDNQEGREDKHRENIDCLKQVYTSLGHYFDGLV